MRHSPRMHNTLLADLAFSLTSETLTGLTVNYGTKTLPLCSFVCCTFCPWSTVVVDEGDPRNAQSASDITTSAKSAYKPHITNMQ